MEGNLRAGGTLLATHGFLLESAHYGHAGESIKTNPQMNGLILSPLVIKLAFYREERV